MSLEMLGGIGRKGDNDGIVVAARFAPQTTPPAPTPIPARGRPGMAGRRQRASRLSASRIFSEQEGRFAGPAALHLGPH